MIWAKLPVARTSAGSIRSWIGAPGPTVVLNHPSWMAKMYCATKATTKIGSEMKMRLTTSALASKMPPLRSPEMRPTVMPPTIRKKVAMSARVSVTGNVSARISVTGDAGEGRAEVAAEDAAEEV